MHKGERREYRVEAAAPGENYRTLGQYTDIFKAVIVGTEAIQQGQEKVEDVVLSILRGWDGGELEEVGTLYFDENGAVKTSSFANTIEHQELRKLPGLRKRRLIRS